MRKAIAAVFAHPDDEAFGPGGTLALLSKTHDVHLIIATGGEAGKNSLKSKVKLLSNVRKEELRESAKILGIKKVYFLGFYDGTLSNNLYHKLASKIQKKLEQIKPETVITFEPNGVSGHIDHITVSFVTTFAVRKLPFVKKLLYYCLLENQREAPDNYFIHFPKGYKKSEIDVEFDTTSVWDIKKKAMLSHKSQKHDAERILKKLENLPKREYFLSFKD